LLRAVGGGSLARVSSVAPRPWLAALAAAATLASSLALADVAAAAPVDRDGKIHACYRVKGKPKGAMRVVRSGKVRCRRGERKVAWVTTGAVGTTGAAGVPGAAGTAGADGGGAAGPVGPAGTTSVLSTSELEEAIDLLTARVASLEGVLQGVTNSQLLAAVAAVPVLESVCGEVSTLVTQTNLLGSGVGSLVSTLTGSLLGPIFGGVSLPPALDPFACTGI
jgi:hypothetical protein